MQRRSGLAAIEACTTHIGEILDRVRETEKSSEVNAYTETEMVDLLDAMSTQAFEIGKICESMKAALGVVSVEPASD